MKKIVLIAMAVLLSGCQAWVQPEPKVDQAYYEAIAKTNAENKEKLRQSLARLQKSWEEDQEYRRVHGVSQYTGMNIHGSNETGYVINGKTYYCHFIGQNKYECTE